MARVLKRETARQRPHSAVSLVRRDCQRSMERIATHLSTLWPPNAQFASGRHPGCRSTKMHVRLLKYLLAFMIACVISQRGLIAVTISLKKDLETYASRGLGVASIWGHEITEIRLDTMTSSKRSLFDLNCRARAMFSPDGGRIGAVCDLPEARYPHGPDEALIVMDAAGRVLRRIEGRFRSFALALTPDNKRPAFQSRKCVCLVSRTNGVVHEIVEANWEDSETWYPSTTAWSPDSRRIVYELFGKLFIADVATGDARYLT